MNPETLLSMLIQTRAQLPDALDTPFLLQKIDRSSLFLSHPMMPEGRLLVDAETETALHTLVQWGYLAQPKQYDAHGFVVTPAGLDYDSRKTNTWDGTERRRRERRAG